MKEKIALVGGLGFVGSRLSKKLEQNDLKHSIFDKRVKKDQNNKYYVNVEDKNSLSILRKCSVIVNLAAEHKDNITPISRYDNVNVLGSKNICDLARENNINKLIFISSVAIYGFAKPNTDENGEPNYFNDYGRTKYLAEQEYKKWFNEDPKNRTLTIIRPTVIFGEANRGNVYNLFNQIASKKFVMIGKGKNIKSMAYIENVVAFIDYCLKYNDGMHIHNYIDKPDMDMRELVSTVRKELFKKSNTGITIPIYLGFLIGHFFDFIAKIFKLDIPISYIRVKKFISSSQFRSSVKGTTFQAPVSLKDGIIKTLRYEFIEDNSTLETFETE
jgi:nucleoside-diphosphate-sugar epimerase